jgi:alcohol dehydrogenase class IV
MLPFIDPTMMGRPDNREVVDGALIALVHAVEAFLDHAAGPMCHAYAHTAIGLIVNHLPAVFERQNAKKTSVPWSTVRWLPVVPFLVLRRVSAMRWARR